MNNRPLNTAPVVHWAAISSGTVIGLGLSLVADALWSAAAFSSHNGAFYHHLAWWYGGTLIAAALLGALSGAALSSTRGPIAGLANGLTTWGLVVLGTGTVAVVIALANGNTSPLTIQGSTMTVNLLRPYVAFWASALALGAAGIGGAAGGLLPRRQVVTAPAMTSTNGRATGIDATPTSSTHRANEAVAS
jgi:hypothetical protein